MAMDSRHATIDNSIIQILVNDCQGQRACSISVASSKKEAASQSDNDFKTIDIRTIEVIRKLA